MNRFERIKELLSETGPQTTAQIAARLGLTEQTTASLTSRAASYGYIAIAEKPPKVQGRIVPYIWRACP